MTKSKKIAIIIVALLIFVSFILFIRSPIGIALLKSKKNFITYYQNPRVRYEPDAEEFAAQIAEFLPDAIRIVETEHFLPFKNSFIVYVCATQKSFNEFIGDPSSYPIRGSVLLGNVFISPSAFSFRGKDTHRQTLMHEFSYLHLSQRLGFFKLQGVPVWFGEGVANCVSGSGGEGIEDIEAINAILNGRHFIPEEKGGLFKSFHKTFSGITPVMFHKQNKMFVQFIKQNYPEFFKQLMLDLQMGKPFAQSFSKIFGVDVIEMWHRFKESISSYEVE